MAGFLTVPAVQPRLEGASAGLHAHAGRRKATSRPPRMGAISPSAAGTSLSAAAGCRGDVSSRILPGRNSFDGSQHRHVLQSGQQIATAARACVTGNGSDLTRLGA